MYYHWVHYLLTVGLIWDNVSYEDGEVNGTPVLLPRKSHGWRSLVGCSPWGREESDTPERLHFHFSLSHNEEGNGNPLQCSCLENPRDGGAWWAAVYGVAQSRTRLKQLSSSKLWGKVVKSVNEYKTKCYTFFFFWWPFWLACPFHLPVLVFVVACRSSVAAHGLCTCGPWA